MYQIIRFHQELEIVGSVRLGSLQGSHCLLRLAHRTLENDFISKRPTLPFPFIHIPTESPSGLCSLTPLIGNRLIGSGLEESRFGDGESDGHVRYAEREV